MPEVLGSISMIKVTAQMNSSVFFGFETKAIFMFNVTFYGHSVS